METDWNETHPSINDGLIRSTLSKAMGNSYVTAERNKYRTRLEAAPNGGPMCSSARRACAKRSAA